MKSFLRIQTEKTLLDVSTPLGEKFIQLTRPDPWRPHNDRTHSLFIHIPRTAGGSISKALFDGDDTGHVPAWVYHAKDKQKFEKFYTFTVVRNPFDRLVSAYHRVLINPSNEKTYAFGQKYIAPYASFGAFVEALSKPMYRLKFMGHPHFSKQFDLININGKVTLSYVGKFETLVTSFKEIAVNFPQARSLGVENKTPHKHYRDYYTDQAQKIVSEIYAKDLITFGYGF